MRSILILALLVSAAACALAPVHGVARCSFPAGVAQVEVRQRCGEPEAQFAALEAMRRWVPPGEPICAAPCDVFADQLVCYDCAGKTTQSLVVLMANPICHE